MNLPESTSKLKLQNATRWDTYNQTYTLTIAQPENVVPPFDVGSNTQQSPVQTESHPPNYALRTASYVAGAVTVLGLTLLAYEIIWVEKFSGREVLAKTFYKARLARRQADSQAPESNPRLPEPGRAAPPSTARPAPRRGFPPARGRFVEVVEPIMSARTIGPTALTESLSPCRLYLDVRAAIYAPEQVVNQGAALTCTVAMVDAFGNERWRTEETIGREILGTREASDYAMGVQVFDVPFDGEFSFKPKLIGPGVFVKQATLKLRANVRRSSPSVTVAGAVMFFVGLLVAISCSKAYELSKPESERSAWVDQPFALGDPAFRPQPTASAPPLEMPHRAARRSSGSDPATSRASASQLCTALACRTRQHHPAAQAADGS